MRFTFKASFQLTRSPFLVARVACIEDEPAQSERINDAKTYFNWNNFTDNDDCESKHMTQQLQQQPQPQKSQQQQSTNTKNESK